VKHVDSSMSGRLARSPTLPAATFCLELRRRKLREDSRNFGSAEFF
jgi:hypothetical protein